MTRVDFAALPWQPVHPGLRQKTGPGMRLVEHGPEHVEDEWCEKAHVGYVVAGTLHIEFRDHDDEVYRAGDGLRIPESRPHKGHVDAAPALLFLVD